MSSRRFFLGLVVAAALVGCKGSREDPCYDAAEELHVCGFGEMPSRQSLDECRSDEDSRCASECLADASCEELQSFFSELASEGYWQCFDSKISSCFEDCVGPQACNTPLVLSFDGANVRFEASDRAFDFGIAMSVQTDWPGAETPWLAIDRNGNGAIDDATELFGSSSPLAVGGRAENGFVALRELDSNGDGWITPADAAWCDLLVWSDRDRDRVSSPGELTPLGAAGVAAIDLAFSSIPRCDARGNCEVERARFVYRDAELGLRRGDVVDVHLRHQRE
ncbi:MAG: calcium-binding protein [Byssovorax sp.]